jgi:DNA-nicking Smr family endonuclease
MSRPGDKPGRAGRAVTDEEARLWEHMTRDLEPVPRKARVTSAGRSHSTAGSTPGKKLAVPTSAEPSERKVSKAPVPPKAGSRAAPPLAGFDRRKARQIASGKVGVDARLDLHGTRQREARARLRAFLLQAYAQGHRTVLVITGKGAEEPDDALGALMGERQRGILRRNVPHWLEEADLRTVVLSYTQASQRHGGAGAIYVQLRRNTRAGREN